MYESLKRLYIATRNETLLTNAVKKGWIAQAQKEEIMKG